VDLFTPFHLAILLLVALLVFGPQRLPEIGRGLGRSIREFRQAMSEGATLAPPVHPRPEALTAPPPSEAPDSSQDWVQVEDVPPPPPPPAP
jgi:sec-independent protein translocase protein TatA